MLIGAVVLLAACASLVDSSSIPVDDDDSAASVASGAEVETTPPPPETTYAAPVQVPSENPGLDDTPVDETPPPAASPPDSDPTGGDIPIDERVGSNEDSPSSTTTASPTTEPPPPETLPSMLFPDARFLWEPIPGDAAPDVRSAAIVEGLSTQGDGVSSLLVEYGIPIYTAGFDTPTVEISCRDEGRGVCGPEQMSPIRMPVDAFPNAGSDGAMVIVDLVEGITHELWRAEESDDGGWSAQWGSSNDIDGDAITVNGGSGSGVSRLGGIVMTDELASGSIPHALAIASNKTCASAWRPPAWTTDGRSDAEDCIEMGSRLQLDPTIDLDILELTDAERIIGDALQTYGAYVVDSSASTLAVFFEREELQPDGGLGPVARSLDFRWDFDPLSGLPWDDLVVLAPPNS